VSIDINGILGAVDRAWSEELDEIEVAMVEAISSDRYVWPNATIRQNGQIVTSPRDIVDTGGLRDSQYKNTITAETTEFGWTEHDPELNHNGGMNTYKGHRYYHTPRPWTQHAISGDNEAPLEYQRGDAILNVPEDFARRLSTYLATTPDAD
jgi:hypothetical protein